jgi:hypothetical protein
MIEIIADDYREPDRKIIGKVPTDDDYDRVISSPCRVIVRGREVLRYQVVRGRLLSIAKHLSDKSEYVQGERTSGLKTRAAIYGYMPRNPVRCDWCRQTSMDSSSRSLYPYVEEYAKMVDDMYPEQDKTEVHEEWRIAKTRFSSLNINQNFAIKYHTDTGNIKGMKSNVFIYRKDCTGGRLVVPGLRVAFEQKMGALIIFDGFSMTHGVTQIVKTSEDYVRSSIVLYTMTRMAHCLPPTDEIKRAKEKMSQQAKQKRDGNPRLMELYKKQLDQRGL